MRHVDFPSLSCRVSAIGFGCASLGSRVDAKLGKAALDRAYDAGVSWFDVAPSYGDGRAESLLGEFLADKRHHVTVCTKVGILPNPVSFPLRVARPLVQRTVAAFPGLRKHVVKFRTPARPVALTGRFIESSVVESLRRLRIDCIDVLALHDACLADVKRDDVLQALDDVITRGYTRTVALAGDLDASLAAVKLSKHFRIIQCANTPRLALIRQELPGEPSIQIVTHSVYGQTSALDGLVAMLEKEPRKRGLLTAAGYRGTPAEAAAAFLLDSALARNPDGVVLVSMYKPQHLRFNLDRLTSSPPADVVLDLAARVAPPAACSP